MDYAVEFYFDAQAERDLRRLRTTLAEHGIPPHLDEMGFRPHVSLALFTDVDPERLIAVVEAFAPTVTPFPLTLTSVSAFPTTEGVVFLAPTPTQHLLSVHSAFHASLEGAGLTPNSYYLPDKWMPHCTTATNLTPAQAATAVEVCMTAFRALPLLSQEIGVICQEMGDDAVRPCQFLATFPLGEVEEEPMSPQAEAFWQEYLRMLSPHDVEEAESRFYEVFSIGSTEDGADEGAALIAQGVKTATSALLWEYEDTGAPLQQVGALSIVEDGSGEPICIVQTTEVEIVPFEEVDAQLAHDYGEWDRTLATWRTECWAYYAEECRSLGREPSETMPLVCERFRVVYPDKMES